MFTLMRSGGRCAALAMAGVLALQAARPLQENPKLRIVILEGEGAINRVEQRTAREVIVQIEDENNKPVAGAIVVFLLPGNGAGGTFAEGGGVSTVTTNEKGQASARVQPNSSIGEYEIRVEAQFQDQTARAVIHQATQAAPSPAAPSKAPASGPGPVAKKGSSAKWIAILAVAGGGAAGAALGLGGGSKGGGGGGGPTPQPSTPNPSIRITGSTVGAP